MIPNNYLIVLRRNFAVPALILGVLAGIGMHWWPPAGAVAWVLIFTALDLLVWGGCIEDIDWQDVRKPVAVASYRVNQWTIHALLAWTVFYFAGWKPLLAAQVFWWSGGCDVLYYLLGRYPLPKDHVDWMKWSFWWFKKEITGTEFIVGAVGGLLAAISILIWL